MRFDYSRLRWHNLYGKQYLQLVNVDNKLYLVTNGDLSDSDYVLCDNVSTMTFTKQVVNEDGQIKVKSVQISMTVEKGNTQQTVSAAAVIRRNLN